MWELINSLILTRIPQSLIWSWNCGAKKKIKNSVGGKLLTKGNRDSGFIYVVKKLTSLNIYPSTVQELMWDTDTQKETKTWSHP